MTEVNRYQIYLNSSQRTSGISEYFQVVLNKPLKLASDNNYYTIEVQSAVIPFSFKQVNLNNNYLKDCSATIDGITKIFDITVPPGNYSATSFIALFQSLVKEQILLIFSVVENLNSVLLNFTYDQYTGKFSFECITPITIFINSNEKNLGNFFGHHQAFSFSNIIISKSTHHVNMSPSKSLFIRCDSIHLNSIEALIEENTQSDILCRVPINTGYNSWLQYSGGIINRITDKIINVLSLYLSPDNAYSIDLDGIDWQISLTFVEFTPLITSTNFGKGISDSGESEQQSQQSEQPQQSQQPIQSQQFLPSGEPLQPTDERQALLDELAQYKIELDNLTKAQDELLT